MTKINLLSDKIKTSSVHEINPFLKLLIFLTVIGLTFIPSGLTGMILIFSFAVIVFSLSNIEWKHFFKTLRIAILMFIMLSLIYTFVITEGDVLFWMGSTPVTYKSVMSTTKMTFRIWTILLSGTIFTKTTSDIDIAWSFTTFIYPLKFLKVPVERIGMTISMGLKFIPQISSDFSEIKKAQKSRGLDMSNSKFSKKIKGVSNAFTPMFVLLFKRGISTAEAMTIGGYDIDIKRTKYRKHSISWSDVLSLLIFAGIIAIIVIIHLDPSGEIIPRFADMTWWNPNIW